MRRLRTVRRFFPTTARLAVMGCLVLVAVASASARSAEPGRAMRRAIPARGLTAYVEYDGLDAHADAWRATAAHDFLVRTPAGAMLTQIVRPLADEWMKEDTGGWLSGDDVLTVAELMVHHGFAFGFYLDNDGLACVLVAKDLGRGDNLKRLERMRRVLIRLFVPSRVRGRTVYQSIDPSGPYDDMAYATAATGGAAATMGPPLPWCFTWWEGGDLILLFAETAEAVARRDRPTGNVRALFENVLDAIEGKQPDVSTHPGFVSALAEGNDLKGFEADGLFFFGSPDRRDFFTWVDDMRTESGRQEAGRTAPEAAIVGGGPIAHLIPRDIVDLSPEQIKKLGLDGITRIVGRWGFQDKALLTDLRVEIPAPRKRLLGLLDQPSFRTDRLPPIPPGVGTFLVGSLDLDGSFQKFTDLMKDLDREGLVDLKDLRKVEGALRTALGGFREEVLQQFGSTWCLFEIPRAKQDGAAPKAPGWKDHALVARVKDPDKVARLIDNLAKAYDAATRSFWDIFADAEALEKQRAVQTPRLDSLPKPERGYQLILESERRDRSAPKQHPTILVGKSVVVLAHDLETARRVVSADLRPADRWKPSAELARAFEGLPRDLTFLAVVDNAASFPDRLVDLPRVFQTWINLVNEDDLDNASIWSMLDGLGLARPGGIRIHVDRSNIPDPDRVRRDLFPSVLAVATDDRGFRIIGREALPLLGLSNEVNVRYKWQASFKGFMPRFAESFSLTFPRFNRED